MTDLLETLTHAIDCDMGEDCMCEAAAKTQYRCLECGGLQVLHQHWVNLNTGEVLDPEWNEGPESHCMDCEAPVRVASSSLPGPDWTRALELAGLIATQAEIEAETA